MSTQGKDINSILAEWTIEEYIAYLYLSIANADMSVSQIELDMIHYRLELLLKSYYPQISVDVKFLLENLRRASEMKTDYERKLIIDKLNDKYNLANEVKAQIVSDLLDLVHADDKLVYSEYTLMHYIQASFVV